MAVDDRLHFREGGVELPDGEECHAEVDVNFGGEVSDFGGLGEKSDGPRVVAGGVVDGAEAREGFALVRILGEDFLVDVGGLAHVAGPEPIGGQLE